MPYFVDPKGNVKHFQTTKKTWKSGQGKTQTTWTNIGSDYLAFDGRNITHHWEKRKRNNLIPRKKSFVAVSGRPKTKKSNVSVHFGYNKTSFQFTFS